MKNDQETLRVILIKLTDQPHGKSTPTLGRSH
jgi:hypothetical protein